MEGAGMTRERLPNRRNNRRFRFEHGRHRYYGDVGFYKDWRPGEIFLDAGKAGTDIQHVARAGAVLASLALQYGCPLDVMLAALPTLEDGSAADPFGALLRLAASEMREAAE
jgi:hypothetical protein